MIFRATRDTRAVLEYRRRIATRAKLVRMAIDVSRELEAEIQRRIRDGRYHSADALLRETFSSADEHRAALRAAIAEGRAQADRGDLVDGDTFLDALEADLSVRS